VILVMVVSGACITEEKGILAHLVVDIPQPIIECVVIPSVSLVRRASRTRLEEGFSGAAWPSRLTIPEILRALDHHTRCERSPSELLITWNDLAQYARKGNRWVLEKQERVCFAWLLSLLILPA
jgi:hypothetical protein